MYAFRLHQDTFAAVTKWLEILAQYDDSFQRENIAGFKSRRIQQKASPQAPPNPNNEPVIQAYLTIDENPYLKTLKNRSQNSDIAKPDKLDADLHALELQSFMEQQTEKGNFEDELENLSDTINDFIDDDEESLIDYFK